MTILISRNMILTIKRIAQSPITFVLIAEITQADRGPITAIAISKVKGPRSELPCVAPRRKAAAIQKVLLVLRLISHLT